MLYMCVVFADGLTSLLRTICSLISFLHIFTRVVDVVDCVLIDT